MNFPKGLKALHKPLVAISAAIILIISTLVIAQGNSQGNSQGNNDNAAQNNKLQAIQDSLDVINGKLDSLMGPQVTATFCISQGRALDLAAKWALEAPIEWEGGVGWREVLDGKGIWKPSHPTPTGLPTEAGIQLGAGLGRLVDICVDLPLELGPEDTALLLQLAGDINANPNDGLDAGKFQRRAHRLLNYTKRRVPGIQTRATFTPGIDSMVTAADQPAADDEFDRVDTAIDNLSANGLRSSGDIFGAFHDTNIVALLGAIDGLPVEVSNVVSKPDQVFDTLSNFAENVSDMKCEDFGVSADLRNDKPGLDRLCSRLEGLPSFEAVENVLSGQLLDGIAELIQPLLENTSGVQETAAQTKSRFCASAIGQRRLFDRYCGR